MDYHHLENDPQYKGLKVNAGVEAQESVSNDAVLRFLAKKRTVESADYYIEGIKQGNVTVLSQAVTLVESNNKAHREKAQEIIEACLAYSGSSIRIGITGVPGAGKSTFIEAFGMYLTSIGKKVAVLAIDPSSQQTKGSILGDKTRMEQLSVNPRAYIRPSPSAGSLGGVARKTRETVFLCEAAGYDVIIIETVGVGQSETAVHSMTDFFLLLMISGAGDELQGIKRGIMEMSDGMLINKADGDNVMRANQAKVQYTNALHLFPMGDSQWSPKVETCSALKSLNIDKAYEMIDEYMNQTKENGYFSKKRREQTLYWMYETIEQQLRERFFSNESVKGVLDDYKQKVLSNEMSSFVAANELIDMQNI
ncbi:MAG: methylmalonyl Co-A mutase-associated GTPase MeaB [Bacteroidales bacterium]